MDCPPAWKHSLRRKKKKASTLHQTTLRATEYSAVNINRVSMHICLGLLKARTKPSGSIKCNSRTSWTSTSPVLDNMTRCQCHRFHNSSKPKNLCDCEEDRGRAAKRHKSHECDRQAGGVQLRALWPCIVHHGTLARPG